MNRMYEYDVIIIGGSVAGLSAASFLNAKNIKTAVVEKNLQANGICTTAINPRSLDYMKRMGVINHIKDYDTYFKINGVKTYGYDGVSCKGFYNHDRSYLNYGHCLPREVVNNAFFEMVKELEYVNYMAPFLIQEVTHESDGEQVSVYGKYKKENITLRAKLIIDAMGRGSFIARDKQLFSYDSNHKRYALFCMFEKVSLTEPMFHIGTNAVVGPGYYTVFPVKDDKVMVAIFLTEEVASPQSYLDSFIKSSSFALSPYFRQAVQASELTSVGPIAFRNKQYTLEKTLMIGDSTGFFDPLTGEGLTQAFITAELASETVINYLKQGNWDRYAESYERRIAEYKTYSVGHASKLQQLLKYPNAYNRFIVSMAKNQKAADWQTCAVGNIFSQQERTSNELWEILVGRKKK